MGCSVSDNPRTGRTRWRYYIVLKAELCGDIRRNSDWVNASTVCAGEYVGLEDIDDGIWNVTSARSNSAVSTNNTYVSKMNMVD